MKHCTKCRRDKEDVLFLTETGEVFNTCFPCRERNRNYRKLIFAKARASKGEYCQKCGCSAPAGGFPFTRLGRAGKRCTRCLESLRRYYKNNRNKIRVKQKKYYETPQAQALWAKSNKTRMEKYYGMLPGQKEQMHKEQEGRCAICNQQFEVLAVDHNHDTGQIRALLCKPCNLGLGNFRENIEYIKSAINYLTRWNS